MKAYLSSILLIFLTLSSFSQSQPAQALSERFIQHFNAENPDSLYKTFSAEMKAAVSSEKLGVVIKQIKGLKGNLKKSEFYKKSDLAETYILDFDSPGTVLLLNFNKNNEVIGFFIDQDKRKQEDGPNTVTITTSGSVLKGTLEVPKVTAKVPVVLLIAGSGPTDRDGNSVLIAGKPNYFKLLDDQLVAKNIAVLRYDKRGVGASTTSKKQEELVLEDFAEDASACIKFLKNDPRFSKIIIAGHSEGALIGMIASSKEKPDAFISLAGPGLPLDEILKRQFKEALKAEDLKTGLQLIDSVKSGFQVNTKHNPVFESVFSAKLYPFVHSLLQYNGSKELKKLKIPVLIVQGSTDLQVGQENATLLKKAYPTAQLKIIEGMNHVLKEAPADRAKNLQTYSADLPLHPQLSSTIVQFVNSLK